MCVCGCVCVFVCANLCACRGVWLSMCYVCDCVCSHVCVCVLRGDFVFVYAFVCRGQTKTLHFFSIHLAICFETFLASKR